MPNRYWEIQTYMQSSGGEKILNMGFMRKK